LKVSRTKRRTAARRQAGKRTPTERTTSESERGSAGRRFAPSQESLTQGGTVYGTLIADQRAKRGLTQTQLAAIIRTDPSTIARIEEGHPPTAEIRSQLAAVLTTEAPSPIHRALARRTRPARSPRPASGTSPRLRLRLPRLSSRWLWGSVAVLKILIAEIRSRLAAVLTTEAPSPIHRALARRTRPARSPRPASGTSPRLRLRLPRLSMLWLWGNVAVVSILIALILGGRLSGSHGSASPLQPSLAVSAAPSALAAVHRTRTRAENVAAAQARRAAERRRERAAAAAAAAAAARKSAAKAARQATPVNVPPVTQPVAPTPAPSGGGGGGGSGSSGPAPDLTHGIGAQGG
jgi:transcriptional regulator with XRE-family HTH domain